MTDIIRTLFGTSWEELSLPAIEVFLASAEDEGLTWEAKGDRSAGRWPRTAQVEKAVCGFANSRAGGVLIIGAERAEGHRAGWAVPGLLPPGDEAALALDRVIRNGLRPVPTFRTRSWAVGEERSVAVVWVEPTDRPPSITRDGRVFERTTGATVPVTDPTALARLFDAGRHSVDLARAGATQAAVRALALPRLEALTPPGLLPWEADGGRPWIGLGVAATAHRLSPGEALKRQSVAEETERLSREFLRPSPHNYPLPDHFSIGPRADVVAVRVDPANPSDDRRHYFVCLGWDGGVGVACLDLGDRSLGRHWVEEVLRPMWTLAGRLVLLIGGAGQLHVSLHGLGPISWDQDWPDAERAREAVMTLEGAESAEDLEVPQDLLDAMELDLRRYGGEQLWT
jgi:hypothetical protein